MSEKLYDNSIHSNHLLYKLGDKAKFSLKKFSKIFQTITFFKGNLENRKTFIIMLCVIVSARLEFRERVRTSIGNNGF